jgi:hypothetical protein
MEGKSLVVQHKADDASSETFLNVVLSACQATLKFVLVKMLIVSRGPMAESRGRGL